MQLKQICQVCVQRNFEKQKQGIWYNFEQIPIEMFSFKYTLRS